MGRVNYRFDEFLQASQAVLVTGEAIHVPGSSPYYVPLREIPRLDLPTTVLVRNAASTSTINPSQDCDIVQNTDSNEDTTALYTGRDTSGAGGGLWRAFIQFNIAALPSSPASVKLRIYCVYSGALTSLTLGVHQVTSTWTETGPKWSVQPTVNPSPASAFVLTPPGPKSQINGWYEADVTNLYNTWKAGTNYGLQLKMDESLYDTKTQIVSRTGGTPPQLVVVSSGALYSEVGTYIDPGPSEFACHYGTGRLRFHSSAAGADLLCDYRGTGSPVDAADSVVWLGTTTGTNTITATTETAIALFAGMTLAAKMGGSNTGAATLNINGLGGKAIQLKGAPVTSGQLVSGASYFFLYDGTAFQLIGV